MTTECVSQSRPSLAHDVEVVRGPVPLEGCMSLIVTDYRCKICGHEFREIKVKEET